MCQRLQISQAYIYMIQTLAKNTWGTWFLGSKENFNNDYNGHKNPCTNTIAWYIMHEDCVT